MKQTSLDAIRVVLNILFSELQSTPIPQEAQWVYQRGPTGWQGSLVMRPSWYGLLNPHDALMERLSALLGPVLTSDYPDQMRMVGTAMSRGVIQPHMILGQLAHESLKRYGTFVLTEQQIDKLLAEVANFFDKPTIRLLLLSPVLNVHGPQDLPPIAFPGGVTMRPITDEEFTEIYGGNPIFPRPRATLVHPDFIFVREIEIRKVVGEVDRGGDSSFWQSHQELLDRCILGLASFKDGGAVGYDGTRICPAQMAFGAAFGASHMWGNEHVPSARYELSMAEASKLAMHVRLFEDIHPSLEISCQRLVDSARRVKHRDGIIDAVVGLESVLLNEVGERHRSEMRFRFSLNYAFLFPTEERRSAFRTAQDLYDLRSQIAHGGQPKERGKIDGKGMTLSEIASLARAVLRQTIAHFMSNPAKPDFLKPGYWSDKRLGL